MMTLKMDGGIEESLDIPRELWDKFDSETKRNIMICFLVENCDVFAYDGDEYTGDCL